MKFVGAVILFLVISSITLADQVRADWIKGYFSPSAGVDSINRFIVLRDYRDSTLLGQRLVRAGDVNSDGIGDFIACRLHLNTLDDTSLLFLGGRPPSNTYSQRFSNFNWSISNIGDVNGDGRDDFGCLRYKVAPLRYQLFFGGQLLSDSANAYFPGVPWFTLGTRLADFDGDGKLDLALVTSIDSHSVKIFSVQPAIDTVPKYIIRDTARNFGDNLVVGDFNGDGYPDLAIAAALNRYVAPPFVKFYWGGPHFDTIPDLTIASPSGNFGIILQSLGDLNGDGYDDIVICGGANDPYGIYFGGPNIDDKLDVNLALWQGGTFYLPPTSVSGGDFNHDGHKDVVLSYQDPNSFSSSFFEIFLGGPKIDSLAEVQIFAADIGGPLWDFGRNIYGIGDFNGDGVDDFVIPTLSNSGCCWRAELNVFAGWNSNPTDVNEEHGNGLPSTFSLHTPYPNPFNPSTTISFDLPKRSNVRIAVFDITGRQVKVLATREYSAGSHQVVWDGTDLTDKPAASGVYFFKLTTDGVTKSVKGMLVK